MSLVDDGIKYKSKDKSKGYELIDGKKYTGIGFNPPSAGRSKKNTHLPNYSTVTDFAKFLGWSISVPLNNAV